MGNGSFYRLMADRSSARHPLLQISETPQLSLSQVSIIEAGRNLTEGRADHIELNGIDRWLGGVVLSSTISELSQSPRTALVTQI